MRPQRILNGQTWTATANGNGSQDALQFPLHRWWESFLPRREDVIVAGREIKGSWVIPQPLGVAVLVVLLSGVGAIYWRMSDRIESQNQLLYSQKELIIRLDQRLMDRDARDAERKEELEKRLQNMDAVQLVLGRDIAALKAQRGRN